MRHDDLERQCAGEFAEGFARSGKAARRIKAARQPPVPSLIEGPNQSRCGDERGFRAKAGQQLIGDLDHAKDLIANGLGVAMSEPAEPARPTEELDLHAAVPVDQKLVERERAVEDDRAAEGVVRVVEGRQDLDDRLLSFKLMQLAPLLAEKLGEGA